MAEIAPPEYVDIDTIELPEESRAPFTTEGYSMWRFNYGQELPGSVARALRILHIRDFALRTLMPDITQKFSSLQRAQLFTADPAHQRDAYLVVADGTASGAETNAAALGWFRPLILPEGDLDTAQYDDFDLIQELEKRGYDPREFVTGAIEIFDGHRGGLKAADIIEASIHDYTERRPLCHGVCVRVGTPRAVAVVEKSGFERLTSEHGGGVFLRMFIEPEEDVV